MTARATQDLASFSLDLDGLTVHSVGVDGLAARFEHEGAKLVITPARGVPEGRKFTVEVEYSGVPRTLAVPGPAGFIHTDDGAIVTGHPRSAPTWFPVNNHPGDPASFGFKISVPDGWQAVANGLPHGTSRTPGRTVYKWEAEEPLSPHLATIAVGHFNLAEYTKGGIRYVDAMDPALKKTVIPRNGDGLAWSQSDDASYKRLTRTVSVPDAGAEFSFWMLRDTEPGWDYAFVEARTPGADNWTTLKDSTGFADDGTGNSCPAWHQVHPFLKRYQSDDGAGSCSAKGSSGQWWAATGTSDGWEHWEFDLADYAGEDVELSITYASDITGQNDGVFVEDIKVAGADGSTSFDSDGDRWDGWSPQGAPQGSRANDNEWTAGSSTPPSQGYKIQQSLDKQPKTIKFLSSVFGKYPLAAAGGIVDDVEDLGFALETQSRPIYPMDYFYSEASGDSFIVRQLALQWLEQPVARPSVAGQLARTRAWQPTRNGSGRKIGNPEAPRTVSTSTRASTLPTRSGRSGCPTRGWRTCSPAACRPARPWPCTRCGPRSATRTSPRSSGSGSRTVPARPRISASSPRISPARTWARCSRSSSLPPENQDTLAVLAQHPESFTVCVCCELAAGKPLVQNLSSRTASVRPFHLPGGRCHRNSIFNAAGPQAHERPDHQDGQHGHDGQQQNAKQPRQAHIYHDEALLRSRRNDGFIVRSLSVRIRVGSGNKQGKSITIGFRRALSAPRDGSPGPSRETVCRRRHVERGTPSTGHRRQMMRH